MAEISRKENKRESKKNTELLFVKQNCRIVSRTEDYIIVMPLDWECAIFLNSFECGGEGARWCIGDSFNFSYWNRYISEKNLFYNILFIKKYPDFSKKIIVQYDGKEKHYYMFDAEDRNISYLIEKLTPVFALIKNDIDCLHNKDLPREVDGNYMEKSVMINYKESRFFAIFKKYGTIQSVQESHLTKYLYSTIKGGSTLRMQNLLQTETLCISTIKLN